MFAIITTEKQQAFENSTNGVKKVPELCGHCGRACRQMNRAEGANRMLCVGCPLAEYCEEPAEKIRRAAKIIKARKDRSAWSKGVTVYALELVEQLAEAAEGGYIDAEDLTAPRMLRKALLNGADDWSAYSWGGCSLIYNSDIAERLCCPSELKRTRNGERRPNSREAWLDTQARALSQAEARVQRVMRGVMEG